MLIERMLVVEVNHDDFEQIVEIMYPVHGLKLDQRSAIAGDHRADGARHIGVGEKPNAGRLGYFAEVWAFAREKKPRCILMNAMRS